MNCKATFKRFIKRTPLYRMFDVKFRKKIDLNKVKVIYPQNKPANQLVEMIASVKVHINANRVLQHWIDESIYLYHDNSVIGNIPPNYSKILECSILELIKIEKDSSNLLLLNSVDKYINRIIKSAAKIKSNDIREKIVSNFSNMKESKAVCLEDALQRILFWSSLFWQAGHKLVGLGRLDRILLPFINEVENDYEGSVNLFCQFLEILHENYEFKSAGLLGDIGQIIILGGLNADGTYHVNKITYALIEAVKRCQITDPKILLRVSDNIPDDLLKSALDCIASGVGSPLLSNDRVVVSCLKEFGYSDVDAHNYVTSACWEPLSYGNSLEQNNLYNFNFVKVLHETILNLKNRDSVLFNDIIDEYKKNIGTELYACIKAIDRIVWNEAPLYSFFTDSCTKSGMDIANGGAVYNNYGLLTVGLGNTVNTLFVIRNLVFEQSKYSFREISEEWNNHSSVLLKHISLSTKGKFFGHDSQEIIELTNEILDTLNNEIQKYNNFLGGKLKFGLSSPSYIAQGVVSGWTLDGRLPGDALDVHISSSESLSYTELINFGSSIKYSGFMSNGNVLDYFVSPGFIENNFDKFFHFIKIAISKGFFQMQMNVVSSNILLEAKKNPEKFPNLIVRVWGFSAYFKDLPDEYKDILIERAVKSEQCN